jgi:hypothetical protein
MVHSIKFPSLADLDYLKNEMIYELHSQGLGQLCLKQNDSTHSHARPRTVSKALFVSCQRKHSRSGKLVRTSDLYRRNETFFRRFVIFLRTQMKQQVSQHENQHFLPVDVPFSALILPKAYILRSISNIFLRNVVTLKRMYIH